MAYKAYVPRLNDRCKPCGCIKQTDGTEFPCAEHAKRPYDVSGAIIAFEAGELDNEAILELFCHLLRTGLVWSLQGAYERAAQRMIDAGYCDEKGNRL